MRIALVNGWYLFSGGMEAVDDVIGTTFPEADVFTMFYDPDRLPTSLRGRSIRGTFLQPFANRATYRLLIPLYPCALETLDLRGYDLVISSDASMAKGVLCDEESKHICYCHTPWRQLYDLYWKSLEIVPLPLRPAYALTCNRLRQWDFVAAQRVDHFVANSRYIQQRIRRYYRRDSTVIYPPVDTSKGYIAERHDNYYFSAGRLTHTKRLDLLITACNQMGRRLLIAGEGREERRLKAISGRTIEFLGRVSDDDLRVLYANCRAFLFAANEDFGIVPVEAQAFGRPVIAYGHGGALETVRVSDPHGLSDTGVLFPYQTVDSLISGIRTFESIEDTFDHAAIREHSHMFDTKVFVETLRAFVRCMVSGQ
jgi:glycosyltransferase involved in cell wall biosynthesis